MTRDLRVELLKSPTRVAERLLDYEYPVPDNLKEIYDAVRRAFVDPTAPDMLVRLMPRDHGKSEAGTHVIPVWLALRDPNVRILLMSETQDQAEKKLARCRATLQTWASKFGHVITTDNRSELTLARTKPRDVPTITTAGMDTSIEGGHFDYLCFDDIISWPSQRTLDQRKWAWRRFQDHRNLGSQGESVFLVLGTRKHPKDLYSNLIQNPAWDDKIERALQDYSVVTEDEYTLITDEGNRYPAEELASISNETIVSVEPDREVDVLWPERWSAEKLLKARLDAMGEGQSSLVWKRENQNDAEALMGQVLSESMLTFVETPPADRKLEYFAGADWATTEDAERAARNETDYWALAVMAYDREADTSYLIDLQRTRGCTFSSGIDWIAKTLGPYAYDQLMFETNLAGVNFRRVARDAGLKILGTRSTAPKEKRIQQMAGRFERGKVKIVEKDVGDWEDLLTEWSAFPTAEHDDQLDAIEIALRWHEHQTSVRSYPMSKLAVGGSYDPADSITKRVPGRRYHDRWWGR